MKIPFGTTSYLSPSRQVCRQRLVNCHLEKVPQGKSQIPIMGTPGIATVATVGSGPLRGACEFERNLFVVSGEELYRVWENGATAKIGDVPGTDRVSIDTGEYIVIATHERVYYSNGSDVKRVTNANFKGASQVAWIAGYYIYLKPKTGVFYLSEVTDPDAIDALDFATAEAQPDNTIAVLTDSTNVIFFGERSTEVWGLRGGSFPLIRFPNGVFDIGCGAANSPAKKDNIAFWLADDKTVRMLDGSIKKISTEGVDDAIAGYSRTDDAYGMTRTVAGRATYVLTFPAAGKTWEYSLNTGLWNELESFDVGHWRGSWCVEAYGNTYVLDTESAKVGRLDKSVFTEFGSQVVTRMVTPPIADGNRWLFHKGLYLDFETGGESVDDAEVMVRWSDDGFNWQPELRRSLGKTGEYTERVAISQNLGRSKNRVYEIAISDPVKRYFLGAEGEISIGGY